MLRLFLFVFAFHMGLNLLETWIEQDITTNVAPVLSQLYGPALYLFFVELMYADFHLEKSHALHLLPASFAAILMITIGPVSLVENILSVVFLLYLIAGLYRILKFHHDIKDAYSDPWGARLDWILMILFGFLAGGLLDSVSRTFVAPGSVISIVLQALSLIIILATLTAMVWKAMNHPRVLAHSPIQVSSELGSEDEVVVSDFRQAIEELFTDKGLHLKPRLLVAEVAEHLGRTPRDVSRLINLAFEQNFSDYVNGRRVETAIALMRDPQQAERSLLQIAFDAGFNSKTAFHDSFKKKMATSPSAWRGKNITLPSSGMK